MTETYILRPAQPKITPILLTKEEKEKHGIDGDVAYRLDEQYEYVWQGPDGRYRKIVVPAGLIYDGASVPRLAWSLAGILPDGLHRAASLIHDWIYIWRGMLPEGSYFILRDHGVWDDLWFTGAVWTRKEADRLFGRIMRESGFDEGKRRAAYRAVRVGGWLAWRT